ncbi:hypothetical protein F0919_08800 [Taibaiella lutea]|uniref:DUF4251 domain-containing protein n=1 Tax=Taibaiella lutea TaxID=2608001 RepID=A0A5M6CL45_9BACT|nr:hypothetical protein [Taibaiella lutea]KAA5534702.1 hypothetical protein F0919_08800 [Taibaiella lutea]
MKTKAFSSAMLCSAFLTMTTLVVNAQQKSVSTTEPQISVSKNTSVPPVNSTVSAPSILPGRTQNPQPAQQAILSDAEIRKTAAINKKKAIEIERSAVKDNRQGMITLNFGAVKQGESITTFFPFNIKTLEKEATIQTPVLGPGSFIRYFNYNNPSGISDVRLAFGKVKPLNLTETGGTKGNGFNITYSPTTQSGAVDETIMVYTTMGNLQYRLIGYVYGADAEITVRK